NLDVQRRVVEGGRERLGLADHVVRTRREHFHAEREVAAVLLEQRNDLLNPLREVPALFFCNQRRVRRDATGDASLERIGDVLEVGRIHEEIQRASPLVMAGTERATRRSVFPARALHAVRRYAVGRSSALNWPQCHWMAALLAAPHPLLGGRD